jgi:hypothetical protein
MAKVMLPLLGVSAHGMLAGQLVYRHRLGETTAGVWKGKRDAKTEAQLARRRMFWEAKEIWPDVDPDLKAEYAVAAAVRHLNSWNYFVGQVLDGAIGEANMGETVIGSGDLIGWPSCPW